MSDTDIYWRDKALSLLRAIAAHYAPPETRYDDLADILAVLHGAPELRARVARILDISWSSNNTEFDAFLTAMERAQRYDGAIFREFIHLTTAGRRPTRDGVKSTARSLLRSIEG